MSKTAVLPCLAVLLLSGAPAPGARPYSPTML
jgi:hypothetical protein